MSLIKDVLVKGEKDFLDEIRSHFLPYKKTEKAINSFLLFFLIRVIAKTALLRLKPASEADTQRGSGRAHLRMENLLDADQRRGEGTAAAARVVHLVKTPKT